MQSLRPGELTLRAIEVTKRGLLVNRSGRVVFDLRTVAMRSSLCEWKDLQFAACRAVDHGNRGSAQNPVYRSVLYHADGKPVLNC